MSRFSSKFDLFDTMSGTGGWFDKNGNPVKMGQEGVNVYYSDPMKDFEAFKKETNGVIYQHIKVKVDEWNQEYVKEHCRGFDFTKHTEIREDKRCKDGKKEYYYYTYTYYGKEYKNLKELNKHGVYITKNIYFDTILELIPYFPYIVTAMGYSEGKAHVVVSDRSYADKCFREHNWESVEQSFYHDRKELAEFTRDIILEYFGDYKERTVDQEFKIDKSQDKYIVHLEKPVDYNFDIEILREKDEILWSSPKILDDNTLDVTHTLLDIDKRSTIRLKYVSKGVGKSCLR